MELINETEAVNNGKGWKSHLGNWGIYAAAAGASLSMATSADAGIISGVLNLTASINPAAGVNGSAETHFVLGSANQAIFVRNLAAHSIFYKPFTCLTRGPGFVGPSCQHFFPRAGDAILAPDLPNVQQLKFFDTSSFDDRARRYVRNSVIAGVAGQSQAAFLDIDNGGVQQGVFPFGTTNDFVGFIAANGDLGWLQVEVLDRNGDGYADQVEAIAYGYNTEAGASIEAGQTSTGAATPEPGTASLALLAAGAAGIVALRKARRTRTGD